MAEAIAVARKSAQEGDYAVGAVIIKEGRIIATGKTMLRKRKDPTLHAEIVAIRNACQKLNSRFLQDCVLYTTHEPCSMCASAAVWAKMQGIVFGARIADAQSKANQHFSWRQIKLPCKDVLRKGSPKLELVEDFLRKECQQLFNLSR